MKKTMTATYSGDSGHYHLFDMDGGQELMGTVFVPKGEPIPKVVMVLIHLRAKALLDAHKRGGKVEIILDKSQKSDQYSSADFLANSGMSVKIDSQHAIAHNKVIIIGGETVITGSSNFTKGAEEKNAENLLVIHDRKLAERYTKNWEEHARHSEVYAGRLLER